MSSYRYSERVKNRAQGVSSFCFLRSSANEAILPPQGTINLKPVRIVVKNPTLSTQFLNRDIVLVWILSSIISTIWIEDIYVCMPFIIHITNSTLKRRKREKIFIFKVLPLEP